jgi:hypothetical protein
LSPGDVELVQVVSSMFVTTATAATIVVVDERRLKAPELARAWPRSSRDAAIFGAWLFGALFGCLLLLVHFARTRARLAGVALGLFWAAILLGTDVGAWTLAAAAVDWISPEHSSGTDKRD